MVTQHKNDGAVNLSSLPLQVTEEIEGTRFNTGISAMMEFINAAYKVVFLLLNEMPLVFFNVALFSSSFFSALFSIAFIMFEISALFCFFSFIQWEKLPRPVAEAFVLLLAPYAPHMAEELWSRLGHSDSLAYVNFPKVCIIFICAALSYPVSL